MVETYEVEEDTTPPMISMNLGPNGQWARTASDATVAVHSVVQYSGSFVDPGATAYDDVDGNLTAQISAFGVGGVNTNQVTTDDSPYIITYEVSDSSGNTAKVRPAQPYPSNK